MLPATMMPPPTTKKDSTFLYLLSGFVWFSATTLFRSPSVVLKKDVTARASAINGTTENKKEHDDYAFSFLLVLLVTLHVVLFTF